MNFLEQNLAIMESRDPELALLMRSNIDCSHIEVLQSLQPDVPTARVTLPSGENVLLHNLEDPIGSAVRSAEKHDMKAANGSVLLGCGLGYLARELARKVEEKHTIIICEADAAILKTALTHVDLHEVLDSDYIRILVGAQIPLQDWIARLATKFMTAKVDIISFGPSVHLNPKAYGELEAIAQKESTAIMLNRNTTLKAGGRMMENTLLNFPEVLHSAGVKHLENLFQGRPAVLVAAGPSLEKNIHLLRELEGRAVIIAVDTALRLLLPL
ncbi:MAG: 6-hydroxymethylpterin diphosphokinase MptE-like protein, partial [Nitrospirota bacterium]|nr:6-hydroxymethylpterin diphosphokinase MptE-like protein [Nitrospirota bacterium]